MHKNSENFRFQLRKYQNHFQIFLNFFILTLKAFIKNSKFLSNYNTFWVLQNSDKIDKKKRAKSIATYDFSTLDTKLPHYKLVDKLSSIIYFTFKEVINPTFEYQQMVKHFEEKNYEWSWF